MIMPDSTVGCGIWGATILSAWRTYGSWTSTRPQRTRPPYSVTAKAISKL
jgi:hypothetical protein